jgi:hypothetical protein
MPARQGAGQLTGTAMGASERGQGVVEFALLVPILLLVVFGALDFGRAFYGYTVVVNAAREGAICASLGGLCPAGAAGGTPGSSITVTVQYDFRAATTVILPGGTLPIRASTTMVVQ